MGRGRVWAGFLLKPEPDLALFRVFFFKPKPNPILYRAGPGIRGLGRNCHPYVRVADFGHARFLNEEEMALTVETGKNLYHFCTIFLLGAL